MQPRVEVLFHQAWLLHGRMEQTHKATAQIHEIWELLIKLKARIVNILCVSHSLASQDSDQSVISIHELAENCPCSPGWFGGREEEGVRKEREGSEERLGREEVDPGDGSGGHAASGRKSEGKSKTQKKCATKFAIKSSRSYSGEMA